MAIKTILAIMPDAAAAERVMRLATPLARKTGAHVIGLHVTEAIEVYAGVAMYVSVPDTERFTAAQAERAQEIAAVFAKATAGEDFVSEWRHVETRSATASDRMVEHARAADLVIMAQTDPKDEFGDGGAALQRTIRKCGRPVLVVPYAGSFATVGAKALIGWSPTREAARAAHDAIPLIEGGEAVILTARHKSAEDSLPQETARELAAAYDRRGIRAEVVDRTNDGLAIGSVLENEAFERGADLIVTGAFGHSRVYDFVIGATTTHLLESMTVPVLFSS